MSESVQLQAQSRNRVGKGAARATRREGRVPAVIYGDKKAPEAISLEYRVVLKEIHSGHFFTTVYTLDVDGKKIQAIPRDLQLDPVRDFPVHVDFLRVSKDAKITVEVPVHFLNEESCPGLKRGGILNIVLHDIELLCPINAIPEYLEVDLAQADIGDSIPLSAIVLPKGVTTKIADGDYTIATIAGKAADEESKKAAGTPEKK